MKSATPFLMGMEDVALDLNPSMQPVKAKHMQLLIHVALDMSAFYQYPNLFTSDADESIPKPTR